MDEANLLYATTHEWVHLVGDEATVGVSRFAVEQLNDVTYLELPEVGKNITATKSFGVIESVKSTNELYAPLTGQVIAVNKKVVDDPSILNHDPYQAGWMIKVRIQGTPNLDHLKDKTAYDQQIAAEGH